MLLTKRRGWFFAILFVSLLFIAPVEGAYVPLGASGWAMVVSSKMNGVVSPYLYEVTENAVTIELDKTFTCTEDGFLKPIQIEFMKTSADATSKIILNEEYIVNSTGKIWDGFDMFLMVDMLNPQAGFDPTVLPDGDQLENVYFSNYYGYNGMPIQLNFRDTNNSGVSYVPLVQPGDDVFQPGYEIGSIEIIIDPSMAVGSRFGLKEIPVSTPEPMTLALLGMGSLFLIRRKKR